MTLKRKWSMIGMMNRIMRTPITLKRSKYSMMRAKKLMKRKLIN